MKKPRKRACFQLRDDLLEVLAETAEELTISKGVLIEAALESFFMRLQLPSKQPQENEGDHVGIR